MVASSVGLCMLKCLLYFLNAILTIMSIVLVILGAFVVFIMGKVNRTDVTSDITEFSSAGILVVVIGVLVVLFVFCGCCGACLGAGWMLIWFSIIMGCLLISECVIVGTAWKYTERPELEKDLETFYIAVLDTAQEETKAVDHKENFALGFMSLIQKNLECCGANGQSDYTQRSLDYKIYCSNNNGNYYSAGCTKKTADVLEDNGPKIAAVTFTTMAVQLLAICLAIFLYFVID